MVSCRILRRSAPCLHHALSAAAVCTSVIRRTYLQSMSCKRLPEQGGQGQSALRRRVGNGGKGRQAGRQAFEQANEGEEEGEEESEE